MIDIPRPFIVLLGIVFCVAVMVMASFGWILPDDKDTVVGLIIGIIGGAAAAIGINLPPRT